MRAIEFKSKIRENKISLPRKMQSQMLNGYNKTVRVVIFLKDTDVYDNSGAPRKKTGLEEALEDVENGRLTTIHTPKNLKAV